MRIEVSFKEDVIDAFGRALQKEIAEDLRLNLTSVKTIDVYLIDADLNLEQTTSVAKNLLTDPVTQQFSVDASLACDFDHLIEVGFKPGVTDNVGRTAVEAVSDILGYHFKETEAVHTAKLYLLEGNITKEEAQRIGSGLLANTLIEYVEVFDKEGWLGKNHAADFSYAVGDASHQAAVAEVDLDVSDEQLMDISQQGVLSLDLAEMKQIRDYYKSPQAIEERKKVGLKPRPTDVELEMLAQTWSEHCKHKIFNGLIEYTEDGKIEIIDSLFDTYIKAVTDKVAQVKKDFLVSVFTDNAGVISFNKTHNLVFKVETHNHPSALDPYGGAITGIVGVNRDPMGTGLGAELIFNTDVFCFGPPDFPYEKLSTAILHPKRIFRGVRRGVEHGGNKIGIPTVNGAVLFDERYVYNPLVYCGTGGLMPKKIVGRPSHQKKVEEKDLVVMVGGRIGKDGIHGATFSSTKLEESTSATAVQIGAPIVQKKMMDALIEARNLGLYNAITDNGAGGLSSSVGEMATLAGGFVVHLEKAPVKYAGLDPWELWVSEAQERMTVAVPPQKIDQFLELMKRRDVEATVLGEFNNGGKAQVLYQGKTVCYLDMNFLHGGLPRTKKIARWPSVKIKACPPLADAACLLTPERSDGRQAGNDRREPDFAEPEDLKASLKKILSSLNVCSKEWVIRQYDHEVQGTSVLKPLVGAANDGPSNAAVIRPLLGANQGVAVSNGINPHYGEVDTYSMAASSIDEAVRNIVAVGGDVEKIALLDNFCWGNPILSEDNPDGDFKLAQLVRAAKACYEVAASFGTPFISGKDSFHNEYEVEGKTIAIPPTLLISAVGLIDDVGQVVSMDVKKEGDIVYVLGLTRDELGGSHYLLVTNQNGGKPPMVDAGRAKRLYQVLNRAIKKGLVSSAHDCSEGGLAVALAESAFAGGLGIEVDLRKVPTENINPPRANKILFSESNSRFVVTVSPNKRQEFEQELKDNDFAEVGEVTSNDKFVVCGLSGNNVIETTIGELKEAWQAPLRW